MSEYAELNWGSKWPVQSSHNEGKTNFLCHCIIQLAFIRYSK